MDLLEPTTSHLFPTRTMASHKYISDCTTHLRMLSIKPYLITLFDPPVVEVDRVKKEEIKPEPEEYGGRRSGSEMRGMGYPMRTPESVEEGPSDYRQRDRSVPSFNPSLERVRQAGTEELSELPEAEEEEEEFLVEEEDG